MFTLVFHDQSNSIEDQIKQAADKLIRELQKGEDSAKKKGHIDISDVEKILKAN